MERDEHAQGRPSTWRLSYQSLSHDRGTKPKPVEYQGKPPDSFVSYHGAETEGDTKADADDDDDHLTVAEVVALFDPEIRS